MIHPSSSPPSRSPPLLKRRSRRPSMRKPVTVHGPAEGDSPIFAAQQRYLRGMPSQAAKIGTVPSAGAPSHTRAATAAARSCMERRQSMHERSFLGQGEPWRWARLLADPRRPRRSRVAAGIRPARGNDRRCGRARRSRSHPLRTGGDLRLEYSNNGRRKRYPAGGRAKGIPDRGADEQAKGRSPSTPQPAFAGEMPSPAQRLIAGAAWGPAKAPGHIAPS